MALYSSASLNGFWDDAVGLPPDDAYLITNAQHQAYLVARTEGKVIDFSTTPPSLMEPPPPSIEQRAAAERVWRDGELLMSDRLVNRQRDERDLGRSLTLTEEQFTELLNFRQDLRDWPLSPGFPAVDQRPSPPAWMASAMT